MLTRIVYPCDIQYSQRHSVINHCDRHITLLSDTDISFGLFNLFTYYTPRKQSLGGGYIGITLSVRLSMYLVSATPPKPLIGFL